MSNFEWLLLDVGILFSLLLYCCIVLYAIKLVGIYKKACEQEQSHPPLSDEEIESALREVREEDNT